MRDVTRNILFTLFILCTLIAFFIIPSSSAYADGGAPNLAYVAGGAQGVSVIDIAQQKVTTTFSVKGDPTAVLLSIDGRLLFVAQPTLQQVTMFQTKTKGVVCTAHVGGNPTLLALDSAQGIVYVAGNASNQVTALRTNDCSVARVLSLHSPVYGLTLANASSTTNTTTRLWIAESNELAVFDAHDNPLASLPLAQGPRFLCAPPGNTVYVATQQGGVVAVDTNTYRVSQALVTGKSFGSMDYDATTGEIYVPDIQQRVIDVLAPISVGDARYPREPGRVLHFAASPQSVAITSDGQLGMVALANGSIAMIDIQTRQTITTIPVGGHPRFIITGLYPPPFNLTQTQFSLLNSGFDILHYLIAGVIALIAIIAVVRYQRLTKEAD